ncbi:MAG: 4-(cytidine 5'-diphospho)-2-C-methyl-D-erythritol kinase [Spirochaetota bacterium]
MHTIFSHAKINLGLKVLYKRADNYHELNSLFLKIDWGDEISFQRRDDGQIYLISHNELPEGKKQLFEEVSERGDFTRNILYKAFQECKTFHSGFPGLDISLTKRIPPGGGLGGGSSNAAALIQHLFWGSKYELSDQIQEIARKVGADVPFFLGEGHAKVSGIGEKLDPFSMARGNGLLLIPPFSIPTKDSYLHLKKPLQKNYTGKQWSFLTTPCLDALQAGEWEMLQGILENDFELYALQTYPELEQLKRDLYNWGCSYVSMTGSGSCFYGLVKGLEIQSEIVENSSRKYPSYSIVPFTF